MSVFILRLLLFILPFALFGLWLYYRRHMKKAEPDFDREALERRLIGLMIGLIVAIVAIAGLMVMLNPGAPPGAEYVAPHSENGEIVPGHYVTDNKNQTTEKKDGN